MTGGILSIDVRRDGVARVVYDAPGEPVNTLKASFAADFEALVNRIESDPTVRGAVLLSGKKDSWIAGADVSLIAAARTAEQAEAMSRAGQKALARVAGCKKPIVAAIHGAALGGGFEVALACHARVLSSDNKTVLGFPEVTLGLLPGLNGLQRLAATAGVGKALEYGLSGKHLRAPKAKALGVADDVVPQSLLEQIAAELALALASHDRARSITVGLSERLTRAAIEGNAVGRSLLFKKAREETHKKTKGHYPAPDRILEVLETYARSGLERSSAVESRAFGELAVSPVAQRLMELFFATAALKKDTGVDDAGVTPMDVENVFVLGAGLMGSGIAYASMQAGLHVRMKDRDDPSVARGLGAIADIYAERVAKGQLTRAERDQKLALLTTTLDDTGLAKADLVIEAVFEDLALKRSVLLSVESKAKPDLVFASNTSSIPIARIAEGAARPENVVGMHYFSPVQKMQLLEVVRAPRTAPSVVATAVAIGKRQGKTVIVVGDGPGFYTTRVLAPYLNEACWLLSEGLAIDEIDRALVAWGWPVGPLALIDEVGIDIAEHVVSVVSGAFGARLAPPPAVAMLAKDGRKGRKNERGLYLYGAGAKAMGKGKHIDETAYAALGLPVPGPGATGAEEIQMRCSLALVNEAAHCLGDGILRSARDGDVGAIFGLGFPPFRGGPFRFVDAIGPREVVSRMRAYEQRFGERFNPAPLLVEIAAAGRRMYA